jgi:beta-aspartyl-peptidase (threonine type)
MTLPILLFAGACHSTPAPLDPVPAAAQVLVDQQIAWNSGDITAFMRAGYIPSTELTFFSGGTVTRGFDEVLRRYTRRYTQNGAKMGRLTFTNLETLALGPRAALARGRWGLELPSGEAPGGLFSLILVETIDGWRILHDHTSSDD